jgi:hypothetical protein
VNRRGEKGGRPGRDGAVEEEAAPFAPRAPTLSVLSAPADIASVVAYNTQALNTSMSAMSAMSTIPSSNGEEEEEEEEDDDDKGGGGGAGMADEDRHRRYQVSKSDDRGFQPSIDVHGSARRNTQDEAVTAKNLEWTAGRSVPDNADGADHTSVSNNASSADIFFCGGAMSSSNGDGGYGGYDGGGGGGGGRVGSVLEQSASAAAAPTPAFTPALTPALAPTPPPPTIHNASHSSLAPKPPKPTSLTHFQAAILSGMASNERMGVMTTTDPSAGERFDTVSPSHPDFEYFASGYDAALLEHIRRKETAASALAQFRPVPSEDAIAGDLFAKKSRFNVQMDDGPRWQSSAQAVSMAASSNGNKISTESEFPFPPPPGQADP